MDVTWFKTKIKEEGEEGSRWIVGECEPDDLIVVGNWVWTRKSSKS